MARLVVAFVAVTFAVILGSVLGAPFPGESDLVSALPGLNVKLNYRHYSGYLQSVNGVHLHYWFFESQSGHAEKDPVVLWLNGGPGCSSMLGALSELGPIRLSRNGSLSLNPYSWNQKANVIFLESPAGVGFSYKEDAITRQDDTSSAAINFEAVKSFFKKFPHLAENQFFLSGESYAGIYIPMLATLLLENKFPTHFRGVAIGNGYLDTTLLGNSLLHFVYHHGLIDSTQWNSLVHYCCKEAHTGDLRQCDFVNSKDANCVSARLNVSRLVTNAHVNRYNLYDECRLDPSHATPSPVPHNATASPVEGAPVSLQYVMDSLLYEQMNLPMEQYYAPVPPGHSPPCLSQNYLATFLNKPEVRTALHVDAKAWEWAPCRSNIGYHREVHSVKAQVKHMVDAGLMVLIYNGDVDSVCNFLGDEWFVEELGFKTNLAYHPWVVDGQVAGMTKFYARQLTFLTVRGAGHMVPEDRPVQALKMINDFLGVH